MHGLHILLYANETFGKAYLGNRSPSNLRDKWGAIWRQSKNIYVYKHLIESTLEPGVAEKIKIEICEGLIRTDQQRKYIEQRPHCIYSDFTVEIRNPYAKSNENDSPDLTENELKYFYNIQTDNIQIPHTIKSFIFLFMHFILLNFI